MSQEELIKLLITYAPSLVTFISFLISLIAVSISKKNNFTSYMLALFQRFPAFIIDAETKGFKDGKSKFNYVFQLAVSYYSQLSGLSYDKVVAREGNTISYAIEDILSTPQKKEVA